MGTHAEAVNAAEIATAASVALSRIQLVKARAPLQKADYQGIGIRIDRPKGYVQRGTDDTGASWERTYKTDYGYITHTEGGDAEELDVYLGPNPSSQLAHWIVQRKADGSFDEYKLMLGFENRATAKAMWADHTPEEYFGRLVTTGLGVVKSLLGIHPSCAVGKPKEVTEWIAERGLEVAVGEVVKAAREDATTVPARALFMAKCDVFEREMLAASENGEPLNVVVKRIFGFDDASAVLRAVIARLAKPAAKDETSSGLDGGGKLGPEQGYRKPFPVGQSDDPVAADAGAGVSKTLVVKLVTPGEGELRYILGIVLEPDIVDAQHDTYDAETIREACWDYNINSRDLGRQHRESVNDKAELVESYCAPVDMTIAGQLVRAGTWLMGWHVTDDGLWADILSGKITGFSIGGFAQRTALDAAGNPA